ncbi:hypothetical protein [Paracoccus rhizosphaerae]|uniref:Uncharacterized protein n=1 Tax=Paracoccus rhizosphaerae TaxID=1133347 RepID=A0ABV6CSR4_9RHOB|nr:hypothetical protein [Paracoccus rhizosphaerae]
MARILADLSEDLPNIRKRGDAFPLTTVGRRVQSDQWKTPGAADIARHLHSGSAYQHSQGTIASVRQDGVQQPSDTITDLVEIKPALEVLAQAEARLADAFELAEVDWSLPARVDAALPQFGLSADPQAPLTVGRSAQSRGSRRSCGSGSLTSRCWTSRSTI